MATPSISPVVNASLNRGLMRQLLAHKSLYNGQLCPLLRTFPKHTYQLCRFFGSAELRSIAMGSQGTFPPLEDVIRDPRGTSDVAMEGLRMLHLLNQRLAMTNHRRLTNVPYDLEVGDIVRHTHFGHVGVVAARLPICLESDEWIVNNLGSLQDGRLAHPWYLVLVGAHTGLPMDFVRYGSQLTHRKLETGRPIGFHRLLPMYFKGYDCDRGRYIPRGERMRPARMEEEGGVFEVEDLELPGEVMPSDAADGADPADPSGSDPSGGTPKKRKRQLRGGLVA